MPQISVQISASRENVLGLLRMFLLMADSMELSMIVEQV
jgi:hypothetical protein